MNEVTYCDKTIIESTSNKDRIDNLILSPSSISHFDCPRKWYYKYLSNVEMSNSHSSIIGEKVHAVLHIFMELEPKFRTYKSLKTICAQECRKYSKEVEHVERDAKKFKKIVTDKALRVFKIINPKGITPIVLEHNVEGPISGVVGQGTIDIVFEENGTRFIADYKSSNFKEKYVDSAIRQVVFYNYLLGYENCKGSILYLGNSFKRYDFDITEEMTEEMLSSFEQAKAGIYERGIDFNQYEPNPKGSCLGCKYSSSAELCPEGNELVLQIQSKNV